MRNAAKWKQWLASVAISLGTGAVSAVLSSGSMWKYSEMKRPPFSPPGWIFPIVWVILYLFMGTAAWFVYRSDDPDRNPALRYYIAQLIFNAAWPIAFFNAEAYWFAFFWLLLLWYLVYVTTRYFKKIDETAGNLMTVYLIWTTFAVYLNLGAAILN